MKQKKLNGTIVFLLTMMAVLIVAIFALGYSIFSGDQDDPVTPVIEEPEVSLLSYEVYGMEDHSLPFGFVVATVSHEDDWNPSSLKTSEGISLGDISSYVSKLHSSSYDLSSLVLTSDQEKQDILLIPYNVSSDYLEVLFDKQVVLSFRLDHNRKVLPPLQTNSDITDGENYSLHISNFYIADMMECDGEEYHIPDSVSVYAFTIDILEAKEGTKILSAFFIQDSSGEKIEALGKEYSSYKISNLLDRQLVSGEKGALFFEVMDDGKHDYAGEIRIRFSGEEDDIVIRTGE